MKLKEDDDECLCLSREEVDTLYSYFKNVFFIEKEVFVGATEKAATLKKFYKTLSLISSNTMEEDVPRYLTKRKD